MTLVADTALEAVAGIEDGASILIGGFGMAGMPVALIDALIEHGATDLEIVSNNAGNGNTGPCSPTRRRPRTEGHLLVSPAIRLSCVRRPVPRGTDRARGRAAG